MDNNSKPRKITVANPTVWYDAKECPPRSDGDYITWNKSGFASVIKYSVEHNGWNICDDGNRKHEITGIEWWTPIIPPCAVGRIDEEEPEI